MTARRQSGFTLIELLVVIAIIAVLAALGAGAYFKIRGSQQEKLTGDTVVKLQKALLQQWTAALDNANGDAKKGAIPDIVKAYCQNDPDRAAAVWGYLNLRKNFPESVAEARSAVTLPAVPPAFPTATVIFPASQVFLDRIPAAAATLNANEQSAVCLYVAIVELNRRGMESGITDNMTMLWPTTAASPSNQYKVFSDTFGQPIAFRRFLATSEMQAKPFSNQPLGRRDPLDPLGKLASLPTNPVNLRGALQTAVGGSRTFDGTNFIPTVFSLGVNRKLDFAGTEPVGDDILGYKLTAEQRQGN
jgi:prepilin-type N-terminal cleavage/methylation domain-containing protein